VLVAEEVSGVLKVRRWRLKDVAEATYILLNLIPIGKVTSYGSIAKVLKISPRLVGLVLKMNKEPIIIPCHRVVYGDGSLGGYTLLGVEFKLKLLKVEGVKFNNLKVSKDSMLDIKELV